MPSVDNHQFRKGDTNTTSKGQRRETFGPMSVDEPKRLRNWAENCSDERRPIVMANGLINSFSTENAAVLRLCPPAPPPNTEHGHTIGGGRSRLRTSLACNSLFTNPVLISDEGEIVAGHGRVEAAKLLGIGEVPTIALSHMSPAERRAYVLADNKLALNAGWDRDVLAIELQALIDLDFDVALTGFSLAEIDFALDDARDAELSRADSADDALPAASKIAVCQSGDLWALGHHRLICGDARSRSDYDALMGSERADMVFTDPPYNVPIEGHVSGLGRVQHREFMFASGEMSVDQFTMFLASSLGETARVMRDGAIAFVCMDWRHMSELLSAGQSVFTELKNLIVWNKTNGGMGAFYRSKHELIFAFKSGTAPHTNSFGLGDTGRYRTNVWDYAGISSISASRSEELAMHPTVKPVAMIADAIRDCSKRGEIILDAFGGSGSTLIAAEKTGRRARLIEYDPLYCDTVIRRWEAYTGKRATLTRTGETFEDVVEAPRAANLQTEGSIHAG